MKYRNTKNKREVIAALTANGTCKTNELLTHLSRQARFNVLDRMLWEELIGRELVGYDTMYSWKLPEQ